MKKIVFSQFEKYLRSNNLTREKYIPFYVHWARKLLIFIDNNGPIHQDACVQQYVDYLRTQENLSDWQIKQADDAVRLFIYHFLQGNLSEHHPHIQGSVNRPSDIEAVINEIQRVIRVKHYSQRTEQTYTDWIQKFYGYTEGTNKRDDFVKSVDGDDVSRFLSCLALNKKVSASTQNQAFHALLFLFRNVLHKDLGDLSQTIRAKRGQRLPVVLSIEEVTLLMKNIREVTGLVLQLLYGSGLRLMEALRCCKIIC